MGGGTTSMAVFAEGQLLHTAQLPIGGLHVTKDLATGLSTPLTHAERLKTLYGNVQSSPDDEREMLPVPLVGEEEHQIAKVPRSMVVNIIRPRLEETFEYVKDRLDSSRPDARRGQPRRADRRRLPARRRARDGGAHAESARCGSAGRIACAACRIRASGPAFATAAGLLHWAAGEGRTLHDIDLEVAQPTGLFRRIVNFLRERV